VPYPRTIRAEETVCTLLADRPTNSEEPKTPDKMDRNKETQELAKNAMNCFLEGSSRTVRQGRADRLRGVQIAARARPLEGQLLLPFARSPQSTKGLLPNHR
jgi:hypothetical protein